MPVGVYQNWETKKVSWKWRLKDYMTKGAVGGYMGNKESLLKMEIESYDASYNRPVDFSETKKVSWKWRLKALYSLSPCPGRISEKQRKSPENGDWK